MKVQSEPNITRNGISTSFIDYSPPTGTPKTAICPGCGEEYTYYDSYIKYIVKSNRLGLNLRFCGYNCRNKFCRDNNIDLKRERELEEENNELTQIRCTNMQIGKLEKKIQEVKEDKFYLAMKDNWTREDFDRDDELDKKLTELEKQVEELRAERAKLEKRSDK